MQPRILRFGLTMNIGCPTSRRIQCNSGIRSRLTLWVLTWRVRTSVGVNSVLLIPFSGNVQEGVSAIGCTWTLREGVITFDDDDEYSCQIMAKESTITLPTR